VSNVFFVNFENKDLFVKESDLVKLQAEAYRESADIFISAWRSRIKPSAYPRRKDGSWRPHYRDVLSYKIVKWTNGQGCSIVFGPRSYGAPHAHLVEDGTQDRFRRPYLKAETGKGHGVRGKYEFVNYIGSSNHPERPPYPAGHPILRTKKVVGRKWKEQAIAEAGQRFLDEAHTLFLQKIRDFLRKQ
jgi:hypothetical protein